MKKIIILIGVITLILISGCMSNPDTWPSPSGEEIIPLKDWLKEEDCCEWEQEFECDQWGQTGKTLYKETNECVHYVLYEDGTWLNIEEEVFLYGCEVDDDYYQRNKEQCDIIMINKPVGRYDSCIQEPYQEMECVHKKVIGLITE